jgi:hypothetical protein
MTPVRTHCFKMRKKNRPFTTLAMARSRTLDAHQ